MNDVEMRDTHVWVLKSTQATEVKGASDRLRLKESIPVAHAWQRQTVTAVPHSDAIVVLSASCRNCAMLGYRGLILYGSSASLIGEK